MKTDSDFQRLALRYKASLSRLILLDYDGTLVPFELYPQLTKPDTGVNSLIQDLTEDRRNHVVILSGRDRDSLERLWQRIPVVLAAEHGAFYKNPGNSWYNLFPASADWVVMALPALNALTFQYKGSIVERKVYSIAWHYRAIADKVSEIDKKQILSAIRALPFQDRFLIYDDQFTIELRTPGIDKGTFVARWVGERSYDFIMAIGDGRTDEDLFQIFGQNAFTIKVGSGESAANFNLVSQKDVLPLLQKLLEVNSSFDKAAKRIGLRNGTEA